MAHLTITKVKDQFQLLDYCKEENIYGNISPKVARNLKEIGAKWKTKNKCSRYVITRTHSGYLIKETPMKRSCCFLV